MSHRLKEETTQKEGPRGVDPRFDADGRAERTARSRSERDAMLAAMARLERALSRAAPERSEAWTEEVAAGLDALREAMRTHVLVADAEDGLLIEILEEEPRLATQVEALRKDYVELERIAAMMRDELLDEGQPQEAAKARAALRQLLGELRTHQSRESDLIWEAFLVDIGVGD